MEPAKISNPIQDNVADTLYIPLLMRCKETHRSDPIFKDPFACDLVEKIDYDFAKYKNAVRSSVGVAVRAGFFDQVTTEFIQHHPIPVVVNVGCGLDTRYQRLGEEQTERAIFYELDLPEVMELRQKLLPASVEDIHLKGSMFETDWLEILKNQHPQGNFLFLFEGVLMFFTKEQVKSVIVNLAEKFSQSNILFDVTSGWMCKNSHRHDTVKLARAPFKLALDDDREIENWAPNLKMEFVRRYGDFEGWKKSGLLTYWMTRFVPFIKHASRILYYRID